MISTADKNCYFAIRGHRIVHLNSLGFREREFPSDKPAGVYRIAILGDSFAYGQGLTDSLRYSNDLERMLNAEPGPHARYEVLNFGKPGADTKDEFDVLQSAALPVHPDFVLLQWFINDPEGAGEGRPVPWPLVPSSAIRLFLQHHSAFYYLLNRRWIDFQQAIGVLEPYTRYMTTLLQDPNSARVRAADQDLHLFLSTCQARGVGVGVAAFPLVPVPPGGPYVFEFLHERVRERCRADGVPCLDLTADYRNLDKKKHFAVNALDAHPGAEANAIAARRMLAVFGAAWRAGAAAAAR